MREQRVELDALGRHARFGELLYDADRVNHNVRFCGPETVHDSLEAVCIDIDQGPCSVEDTFYLRRARTKSGKGLEARPERLTQLVSEHSTAAED